MDSALEYALRQAIYDLKPHWLPEWRSGRIGFDAHPRRLEFVVKADATADTLEVVRRRLNSRNARGETREQFLRILAEVGSPEDLAFVLNPASYGAGDQHDAGLHARVLPVLRETARRRNTRPAGDLAAALDRLWNQPAVELRAEALRLAGAWKLEPMRPRLSEVAGSASAPESLRRAAIEGLGALGGKPARTALDELSRNADPEGLRISATTALAEIDLALGAERAAQILSGAPVPGAVTNLFPVFLRRGGGARVLAEALAARVPNPSSAREARDWLAAIGREDAELIAVLRGPGAAPGPLKWSRVELEQFMRDVLAHGNSGRGETIFRRPELGCLACHSLRGEGGWIGPDLNSIGSGQPLDFIIGAVLEPNREVKEGFEAVEIETTDGEIRQGYLVRAGRTELALRDTLENREIRIPAADVRARRARGSLMPSGLVDHLSRDELRDLFRFLSDQGKSMN